MAEHLGSNEDFDYSFDSLIYDLADRMRKFDAIQVQCAPLRKDLRAHQTRLEVLDPSIDLDSQPDNLGIAALGMINTALSNLSEEERQLTSGAQSHNATIKHIGRSVLVTALHPQQYFIGTSRENRYGQLDGLSKWYDQRKGIVQSIDLEPKFGGAIMFKGRGNRYHSAYPLVSRAGGYVPAFQIDNR